MKKSKRIIQEEGQILETLPNANFRVRLGSGKELIAYLSGNMRRFRIKVLPGDRVRVEMSPHDKTRGRIVYRLK